MLIKIIKLIIITNNYFLKIKVSTRLDGQCKSLCIKLWKSSNALENVAENVSCYTTQPTTLSFLLVLLCTAYRIRVDWWGFLYFTVYFERKHQLPLRRPLLHSLWQVYESQTLYSLRHIVLTSLLKAIGAELFKKAFCLFDSCALSTCIVALNY